MSTRLNWRPITEQATHAAEALGHKLERFEGGPRSQLGSNLVRTAGCSKCHGCCWIAYSITRGFGAGGRLLHYACGTPEAMGMKSGGEA